MTEIKTEPRSLDDLIRGLAEAGNKELLELLILLLKIPGNEDKLKEARNDNLD